VNEKNLWNLFLTTGDLSFYLELKKIEVEDSKIEEQSEGIDYGGAQNI